MAPVILITGAAGNLGSRLARHLISSAHELRLMYHRTPSPLTRDVVRLGRVPHWRDTRRARADLVPQLIHPTLESGLSTL